MLRKGITESFGAAVHSLSTAQLTEGVINRSKRMILDTLGVGLLGTRTAVFNKALTHSQSFMSEERSSVWGKSNMTLPPHYAAFVNGIAVHSMDFDDTWHPATHPSGAVLPALLALVETLPCRTSGLELLLAFNVGIEVQGRLMRFSREAHNIPERFHPPSVVGVMGSAAASAKLLGNAARRGLEAAQLAQIGLEGNPAILDLDRGFGVYYKDYSPSAMPDSTSSGFRWILEDQDVAFKRIPAHLGMHWVVDAALAARGKLVRADRNFDLGQIRQITLRVPLSKYIDCSSPATEHQARHSFQFNACSALLDDKVTVASFSEAQISRTALRELLSRVRVETPEDNRPSFDEMYCEVELETVEGQSYTARCDTFYGHWRKPLSHKDLVDKFRVNASSVLCTKGVEGLIDVIGNIERVSECMILGSYLRMTSSPHEQLYSVRYM
ncbi:unnamed protein product [Pleuronectes platessa]|uniref:Uncharacterized protein n=1 Tax=Pleuronectes platessa TaxID=8262 RepID=A0A9N7VFQ0_PLEPL|nr:unnamed protein product [Pleuronectes platessa]